MRLIFIRHAEPDYAVDSLTEKGFREAQALVSRTRNWKVTDFFCSPLGRACDTAKPTLDFFHATAEKPDWLQEFYGTVPDRENPAKRRIPWDFTPDILNRCPELFSMEHWLEASVLGGGDVGQVYQTVCEGLDGILLRYGYARDGLIYRTAGTGIPTNHFMKYNGTTAECTKKSETDETTLVLFCHLGVMLAMVSHLINIPPTALWQGVFIPPSSVTVLASEERVPGEAYFRIQTMGDTSHLRSIAEPVSYYGYFTKPFSE